MFTFGVDYYPEQWPEERWAVDARGMAEAGFNTVRLAEFAWSRLEPERDRFEFAWLDRALARLAEHGLCAVLGTPTASPPPWLMHAHPDLLRVRFDGVQVTYGNRREYCPNHPLYREASCRIVRALADHYASHPAVIGWQIDNEFGERCYCPVCVRAFQQWLQTKYGSLSELNARWGTTFWSHEYTGWEQIPVPAASGGSPNPGLALDYARFMSDSYVSFQQEQVDLLRARCPGHFITHNFMGFGYDRLNYYDLARSLDLVSWDNYPRSQWAMQPEVDPGRAALSHDTMRGLKRGSFWVMEQQAGSGGWEIVSVAPRPGELRLWAYQSIAHGADGILFFRWRTSRFGTEQYWHGLLDHDGRPSRRYDEIKRMGEELCRIGPALRGTLCKPAVALLLSYESRFAFQAQPNNPGFSYDEQFAALYRALFRCHAQMEVLEPGTDLSGFKLILAPALHVVSEETARNLARFVASGGTLVVTARSGVKDEFNAVVNSRLPGLLAELCGVEVEEYDSLAPGEGQPLELALPGLDSPGAARVWCDVLHPTTAQVIARYTREYYAGRPAITLNRWGQGEVVYVGTPGDEALNEALARWLLPRTGVRPPLAPPPGVELTERLEGARRILFLLNHTATAQQVELDRPYVDLISTRALERLLTLAPREVAILT